MMMGRCRCSEFSLENEVLKPFFLAGISGCPTVRKFREFVAAVAGLLLFPVVCLSLFGVSFICFLFVFWANGACSVRATFGRAWVNSTNPLRRLPLSVSCLGQCACSVCATFGRAWVNSMNPLRRLPLSVSSCGTCILGDRTFHTFVAAMGRWVSRTTMALSMGLETE